MRHHAHYTLGLFRERGGVCTVVVARGKNVWWLLVRMAHLAAAAGATRFVQRLSYAVFVWHSFAVCGRSHPVRTQQ